MAARSIIAGSILDQRKNVPARKLLPPVQEFEFDREGESLYDAAQLFHQAGGRASGATGGQHIVQDQNPLARLDRIAMRCPDELIVGLVQLGLRVVEEYPGAIFRHRRTQHDYRLSCKSEAGILAIAVQFKSRGKGARIK